jgi:hypothetical protein
MEAVGRPPGSGKGKSAALRVTSSYRLVRIKESGFLSGYDPTTQDLKYTANGVDLEEINVKVAPVIWQSGTTPWSGH